MTQTFYVSGGESSEGEYAWVVANRTDVGALGEISGNKYIITAKATRPGDNVAVARIKADVIIAASDVYVVSWQLIN